MKKTLSIILVLVMVLGLLAGCGGSKEESKAPASQAPSSAAPEKQPEASADPIVLSIGHVNAGTETDQLHWAIMQADVKLQELSDLKSSLEAQLEEKMERWVYLNELAEKIANQ